MIPTRTARKLTLEFDDERGRLDAVEAYCTGCESVPVPVLLDSYKTPTIAPCD